LVIASEELETSFNFELQLSKQIEELNDTVEQLYQDKNQLVEQVRVLIQQN